MVEEHIISSCMVLQLVDLIDVSVTIPVHLNWSTQL